MGERWAGGDEHDCEDYMRWGRVLWVVKIIWLGERWVWLRFDDEGERWAGGDWHDCEDFIG